MTDLSSLGRREMLGTMAAAAAGVILPGRPPLQSDLITRAIASSGERLPAVGLGSWITFNVGDDRELRGECTAVMRAFFELGGRVIDSSPMYGSSQEVIGHGMAQLRNPAGLFAADKVWTSSGGRGREQIEVSRRRWGIPRFDLVQVHNLLSWEAHLPVLFDMKAAGQVRYVGITTSEGRRHREIEEVMTLHPIDFVQVTYNILDREVENRILPLARERRIAVIANRPFREGALIRSVQRQPLPRWASEFGAGNWAQFLLKFIISHPVVTCTIPATSQLAHVRENMGAARGALPDPAMRERMISHVEAL
jgi:diketogulonate reductase-like aldo/keto reductase